MQKNKPDYYNNLDKVNQKIWEMLNSGLKNRDAPFHIPVFICGNKDKFDGRIIVLRGVDEKDKKDLLLKPEEAKRQRFGYHYFEGARKRILVLEASLQKKGVPQSQIQDAVSGFVGPIEMMQGNVNALVPHNRILRPGDR